MQETLNHTTCSRGLLVIKTPCETRVTIFIPVINESYPRQYGLCFSKTWALLRSGLKSVWSVSISTMKTKARYTEQHLYEYLMRPSSWTLKVYFVRAWLAGHIMSRDSKCEIWPLPPSCHGVVRSWQEVMQSGLFAIAQSKISNRMFLCIRTSYRGQEILKVPYRLKGTIVDRIKNTFLSELQMLELLQGLLFQWKSWRAPHPWSKNIQLLFLLVQPCRISGPRVCIPWYDTIPATHRGQSETSRNFSWQ